VTVRTAAVSAASHRDLEECFVRFEALVRHARYDGVDLLVLPAGTLGGYPGPYGEAGLEIGPPPAVDLDGPEVRRLCSLAGGVVVVLGLTEQARDGRRYETALCLSGDGVHGEQRRVHLSGRATGAFEAFATPVGRLGLLVGYDKAFPEAARSLAVDGAELICSTVAWTGDAAVGDAYDTARAAENQVFVVSAGQCGRLGPLQLCGSAKVVSPSGSVLATTGAGPGTVVVDLDLQQVARARRGVDHLACLPDRASLRVPA
jgi:predicted amidohydrolase